MRCLLLHQLGHCKGDSDGDDVLLHLHHHQHQHQHHQHQHYHQHQHHHQHQHQYHHQADSVCIEGEEDVCQSGNCHLVDGSETFVITIIFNVSYLIIINFIISTIKIIRMELEYKRRGVCLQEEEVSCDNGGAQCGPGGACRNW